jgi:methylthioribose-1-phosphate isomerase
MIKTIYFENNGIMLLDQSRIPAEVVYERCEDITQVITAIKELKVRGAPLIGVTAAFALAMAIKKYSGSPDELDTYFYEKKNLLAATRPTAVNLFGALERMEKIYQVNRQAPLSDLGNLLMAEAQAMYEEDINVNQTIGEFGQELLDKKSNVLTICNAGALATCGYGTALGIIRSAARRGKIERVWACETRPVLQGSRLTVWELMQDNIPVSLITDSMAGYTMKTRKIDAVIVGADRVSANGDVANKIGTFTLAVLAQYHHIPFYVAAPLSSIDISLDSGDLIPIEERNQDEVRQIGGIYLTVPEVEVFNPAFDVTPHELIKGIITEKGVLYPPFINSIKTAVSKL